MITITRQSIFSGKTHSMELPLLPSEYHKGERAWGQGKLVQEAFPTLNATQREFLMTGASEEEQKEIFG